MNDIEKAIKTLKKVSDLDTNLRLNISNYDLLTAIEVLQEKAEREALQSKCISCKDRKASVTVSDLFCNSCGRKLPKEGY